MATSVLRGAGKGQFPPRCSTSSPTKRKQAEHRTKVLNGKTVATRGRYRANPGALVSSGCRAEVLNLWVATPTGSHIRLLHHDKEQLQKYNEITLWFGINITQGSVLTGHRIRKVETTAVEELEGSRIHG